jgi:SAM-dependent methyltransferase
MNCKICNENNYELLKTVKIFNTVSDIVKCKKCNFVFVTPLPSQEYIKRYYSYSYYNYFVPAKDKDGFSKHFFKKFFFKIKFYVSIARARSQVKYILKNGMFDMENIEDKKILDVGCGNGALLSIFHKMKWSVFGLEPNKYFANETKKYLKIDNIFTDTLETHNLLSEKFDLVTICHILEHAVDPINMLLKAKDLLKERKGKDKGKIFLEVRNIHDKSRDLFKFVPKDELYFYSKDTLKKILEKAGFSIVSIDAVDTIELSVYEIIIKLKKNIRELNLIMFLINFYLVLKILIIIFFAYIFRFDHAKYHNFGENIGIRALVTC